MLALTQLNLFIMSEIKVSGRIRVNSFYKSFTKSYPYLYPALKYPDGKPVDEESTIANARAKSKGGPYTPTGEAGLSVHGNLNVSTFEKNMLDNFSINCEMYYKKNGRWVKTSANKKSMSLSELNRDVQKSGGELIRL